MKKLLLLIPIIFLLLFSCTTSKSLSKKAIKLEQAGQYSAAADLFYQSIRKNPSNTNAIIGMNRTGKRVLSDYLQKFSKYAIAGDYKNATYAFLDAQAYRDKLKALNVDIEIPSNTSDRFEEVKLSYITQLYEDGLKQISTEQFKEAEKSFNEVYKFNQSFRDVAELRNIAYLEPYYRKAENLKDEKQYREAYNAYNKILSRVGNYKDTREHMEYVLKKGRINISLSSVTESRYAQYGKSIKQYTLNAILKANDPFIKVVDREDIEKVLQEQKMALDGRLKSTDQVKIGEIAGAQYTVIFDVASYGVNERPLRKKAVRGYEKYSEKYKDAESQTYKYRTKYKAVTYYEYSAFREVSMTINYKIVSLGTGEVIGTDIINKTNYSELAYVDYSGKKSKLYPSNDGHVNSSTSAYRTLQKAMSAPRTLSSRVALTTIIYQDASSEISKKILSKFS